MIRISDILDRVSELNPDLDIIKQAYVYSARAHDGQVRLSGEPYLSHPLEVAGILADMNLDSVSIAAGLLHDVLEDTSATEEDIRELFGDQVVHIVSGVTKLSMINFDSSGTQAADTKKKDRSGKKRHWDDKRARHAESMRKMFLAMADDIRVILIKLADRLHNMRTLQFHTKEYKKKTIAQETYDIYAPISARLGIYWMKKELEDAAFKYVHPEDYEKIKKLVSMDKTEREDFIIKVTRLIKNKMEENRLKCEVLGRYKHFNSVYQKMITQNLAFENVYDVIAFRIILNNISQCYKALGLIHSLWKPIDGKFKDYIALPKPNMYQSLHTTVIGPEGRRIEIQIRTFDMDNVAKSGIAAHWSYKEGQPGDKNITETFAGLYNLIKTQDQIRDPEEFMENVRLDLYNDNVYVFTPKGEVKTFPKGATPIDFAYEIHTEVGHQCTGARVNNRMVPISYELKTGEVVEVITTKKHHPGKDWLKFVKTGRARAKIRQWIKVKERTRSISLGKEMCEKVFRKHHLKLKNFLKDGKLLEVAEQFGFKTTDDLIANIGYGKITPLQIVSRLIPKSEPEKNNDSLPARAADRDQKKTSGTGVLVKGLNDILIKFGKCCQPVPGDSITGYITHGLGITIHRTRCINALNMNSERRIEVSWNKEIKEETYPVKIRIDSKDRVGLLADVTAKISKYMANILKLDTEDISQQEGIAVLSLSMAVKDTEHLKEILSSLKKIKGVFKVTRLKV
jgi:GTP diphosphokinase / guanosine-3',5'-bis(diphosphate) 3'-diphosphatase